MSIDARADIVSRYIWRGMNLSTSPAIQPNIEFNIGNFCLGSWGSYTFSSEPYQEVDLYLSYSFNSITLTINNYFVPVDSISFNNNYFNWNKNTTPHALEAMVSIDNIFNSSLSFSSATILYGNDLDGDGNKYFSTYFELNHALNIGDNEVSSFLGLTPFESLYAEGFSVTNIGLSVSRKVQLSDHVSLPFYGSFIINPNSENAYLVFGLSF